MDYNAMQRKFVTDAFNTYHKPGQSLKFTSETQGVLSQGTLNLTISIPMAMEQVQMKHLCNELDHAFNRSK